VRPEPLLLLPEQEVRGVGGIHHVDVLDAGLVLLVDALEDALRPGALDLDLDLRVIGAENLRQRLGDLDVDGGVPDDLAFLLSRGEHRRRGFLRGGDGGDGGDCQQQRRCSDAIQDHDVPPCLFGDENRGQTPGNCRAGVCPHATDP
jgi:hypothetical protein